MASTSAFNDRIAIMNKNIFPEWDVSPQVLLDCDMEDQGCHGGDPDNAYEYMVKSGITSETCNPYEAVGHDTGRKYVYIPINPFANSHIISIYIDVTEKQDVRIAHQDQDVLHNYHIKYGMQQNMDQLKVKLI